MMHFIKELGIQEVNSGAASRAALAKVIIGGQTLSLPQPLKTDKEIT